MLMLLIFWKQKLLIIELIILYIIAIAILIELLLFFSHDWNILIRLTL